MDTKKYENKYVQLVTECATEIIGIFKKNRIKKIDFSLHEDNVDGPNALFFSYFYDAADYQAVDEMDFNEDTERITLCGDDGYEGYITAVNGAVDFASQYLPDIYRAVVEVVNDGLKPEELY